MYLMIKNYTFLKLVFIQLWLINFLNDLLLLFLKINTFLDILWYIIWLYIRILLWIFIRKFLLIRLLVLSYITIWFIFFHYWISFSLFLIQYLNRFWINLWFEVKLFLYNNYFFFLLRYSHNFLLHWFLLSVFCDQHLTIIIVELPYFIYFRLKCFFLLNNCFKILNSLRSFIFIIILSCNEFINLIFWIFSTFI